MTWQSKAVCRDEDALLSDLDIEHETKQQQSDRHEQALQVCRRCPVASQCLAGAKQGRYEGVWGGEIRKGTPPRPTGPVTRHGDRNGADQHRRRGERPCPPCAAAEAASVIERRAKQRQKAMA